MVSCLKFVLEFLENAPVTRAPKLQSVCACFGTPVTPFIGEIRQMKYDRVAQARLDFHLNAVKKCLTSPLPNFVTFDDPPSLAPTSLNSSCEPSLGSRTASRMARLRERRRKLPLGPATTEQEAHSIFDAFFSSVGAFLGTPQKCISRRRLSNDHDGRADHDKAVWYREKDVELLYLPYHSSTERLPSPGCVLGHRRVGSAKI